MERRVLGRSKWVDPVETLHNQLLFPGLIDKSRSASMLLMAHARDLLLTRTRAPDFPFSQPFLLTGFLKTLLHPDHVQIPHSTNPKTGSPNQFASVFTSAYTNFTHFVPTSTPLSPHAVPDLLHGLLQHHAALQLRTEYDHWELLIPLYLGDPSRPFDRSQLGGMLIRTPTHNPYVTLRHEGYHSLFPTIPLLSLTRYPRPCLQHPRPHPTPFHQPNPLRLHPLRLSLNIPMSRRQACHRYS